MKLYINYGKGSLRSLTAALVVLTGLLAVTLPVQADPRIELLEAVKADDGPTVAQLLRRGVSPNTREREYGSAPVMAATLHAWSALRALAISPRVDLNVTNKRNETPLMLAAISGELEIVRLLVEHGAEVNRSGWSALHYAATGGHVPVLRYLIEQNAYIDAESPNKTTPLMMAARHQHIPAVHLLVDLGADPSAVNEAGVAAADYMRMSGQPEEEQWLRARAEEFRRKYGSVEQPVTSGGRAPAARQGTDPGAKK